MLDVTIIVPAYNETKFLGQTLRRLTEVMARSRLTYEILVIDNGSTDETASLAEREPGVVVVRLGQRLTISLARNAGAAAAKGSVLAFVDADVLVTHQWRLRLDERCTVMATTADRITGAQYKVSENPCWIEKSWFKSMEDRKPNYINGGNIIISRALFADLKGFDPQMVTGEDVELSRRARDSGYTVESDPAFQVHHEGYPKDLIGFFKREVWSGRGDVSSIATFLKSRTAQTAFVTVTALGCALLLLAFGYWKWTLAISAAIILLSMLSVHHKYGYHSFTRFTTNVFLMLVQLVARGFSFLNFEKKA